MQDSHPLMQPVPELLTCSPTRESALLEHYLQSEFNEDIARIFDESIYSDLELGSRKFDLRTHTCFLKTRTPLFYKKIEKLLQVNLNRELYEELYSFISDVYTDCDPKLQEKELLENLDAVLSNDKLTQKENTKQSETHDSLVYISDTSPSIEINKKYYALVQVDNEIDEQNIISSAFKTIIKNQASEEQTRNSISNCASHFPKTFIHSTDCDSNILKSNNNLIITTATDITLCSSHISDKLGESFSVDEFSNSNNDFQSNFSPDSLIADDHISLSEYLCASNDFSECNINITNMNYSRNLSTVENVSDSIDSGVENTGIYEDLTDSKESSLQSDLSRLHGSASDIPYNDKSKNQFQTSSRNLATPQNLMLANSILNITNKDQIRPQNEELNVLESSFSLETGSWQSVFPQKSVANNPSFILKSNFKLEQDTQINSSCSKTNDSQNQYVKGGATKSTVCFIDAASLVDDEDQIKNKIEIRQWPININEQCLPAPSEPLPCSTIKPDLSPNDGSECHDNEDSLEQQDADSLHNDISPTIFDLALTTDDNLDKKPSKDSLALKSVAPIMQDANCNENFGKVKSIFKKSVFLSSTPHNSILSLQCISKTIDSEEGDSDSTVTSIDTHKSFKKIGKFADCYPIVSGGASIEDHLPQKSNYMSSPPAKRRLDNIVSASSAEKGVNSTVEPLVRSGASSSWVVDMSKENILLNKDTNFFKSSSECIKPKNKNMISHSNLSSENCFDSDSSDRSSEKFYIDFSSLPEPEPTNKDKPNGITQKKNIFSMYIDLRDDTSTLKERPARLSSTVNIKKKMEAVLQPNHTVTQLVKADSNITSQQDASFEDYEELCKNPDMSISEILTISDSSIISDVTVKIDKKKNNRHKDRKEKQDKIFYDASVMSESFVRLSDLDKPATNIAHTDVTNNINDPEDPNIRMTRSIPGALWDDQSPKGARSSEVISSFHSENALSLNRLFPHLKNEFSRSMPGSLSNRTRSPFRIVEHVEIRSDISELSSAQSSFCRSVVENSTTTDDSQSQTSSLISNCQSKLGQDLLRMFLEEIAPDVIVEVKGRRFKAHKCILSSRCQFFAGFLSGGWVESAGNVIILPPFSYNVVHFALCHIYSGLSTIPDSVSIVELAGLADMLGLEGLKEAIMFTLKARYCHHFHKPCYVCIAGVLECFPLSSVYGLDELYRKCLRWITKYFHKVWPTKAFASLPKELLDKCYQHHIIEMSTENVIDTVCLCGITEAALSNVRWAEVVRASCRRLQRTATHFAAARLTDVLLQVAPLPAVLPPAASSALKACIVAAIQMAPHEEIERSRTLLVKVLKDVSHSKPDVISSGEHVVRNDRNSYLVCHASEWLAVCVRNAERALPRIKDFKTYSSPSTPSKKSLHSINIDHVRACFVPYAVKPKITRQDQNISTPRKKVVPREPPQIKTTKAQEERAKYNAAHITGKDLHDMSSIPRKVQTKLMAGSSNKLATSSTVAPARLKASPSVSSRGSSPAAMRPLAHRDRTPPVTTKIHVNYATAKHISKPSKPCENASILKNKSRIPVMQKNTANSVTNSIVGTRAHTNGAPKALLPKRGAGSLLSATESSSAKIVPKVRKDQVLKPTLKTNKGKQATVSVMQRSNTFSKDEPTFKDKTTNIDIGQSFQSGIESAGAKK